MPDTSNFHPARDGFGFRNPVGAVPSRAGGGPLRGVLDAFLYGKGLCFGMVAAAMCNFADDSVESGMLPLAKLAPTPDLIAILQRYHARQYRPRTVLAAVLDWLRSWGGGPERVVERIRLVGVNDDPHVLCFGPMPNRRFLRCMARAHAVAPYRAEVAGDQRRVYVYDPNHPKDDERCVVFRRDGAGGAVRVSYDGFDSREGWGVSLVALSVTGGTSRPSP